MSRNYLDIVTELDSNIPRDVVSTRDGGGGRKLSYLEGHYVIDRLNKVLGHGNWAYSSEVTPVYAGTLTDKYGKEKHHVSYIAKVKMVVMIGLENVQTEFTDFGYGDGQDPTNPGKAHELAVKESVTDGIKRCAKNLGMSMGLALYNKTQENIDDAQETNQKDAAANTTSTQVKIESGANGNGVNTPNTTDRRGTGAVAGSVTQRDNLLSEISAISRVKIAKKKLTREEALAKIYQYGVKDKNELSDAQLVELKTQLESL